MPESRRPGPNARTVGRGRVLAVPIWLYIGVIGVGVLFFGGGGMSLAIGIPFTALAVFGLWSIAYSRVWVEGSTLYVRQAFGHRPPIDLAELRSAELTEFRRHMGPQLFLTTSDGTRQRLDATNLRLKPLYGVLAQHIPADSTVANRRLHKRMTAARPAVAVPPSGSTPGPSWPM
jgi:hypothetical protein